MVARGFVMTPSATNWLAFGQRGTMEVVLEKRLRRRTRAVSVALYTRQSIQSCAGRHGTTWRWWLSSTFHVSRGRDNLRAVAHSCLALSMGECQSQTQVPVKTLSAATENQVYLVHCAANTVEIRVYTHHETYLQFFQPFRWHRRIVRMRHRLFIHRCCLACVFNLELHIVICVSLHHFGD